MRRLFVFTFGLVSFFALPGAIAMAQTESNVSRIAFIDGSFNMDMDNCNGAESIFNFKISSSGTGGAKVLVVNTTNNVVGETRVDITSPTTDITVGIRDGYVGEATVSVEADNYVVAAGEKGDQTAKNEFKIAGVGRANCALDAQEALSRRLSRKKQVTTKTARTPPTRAKTKTRTKIAPLQPPSTIAPDYSLT
ncbi:hypothetical protein HY312_00675 [Candidatus Saccharibacteria bacterium]|nr:hypothetical protein [Candidatus Saccharibacteria bacterium]